MSEALKLKNQLCHRLYRASNAFTRAYRPLLQALDLTYPQYLVLLGLWEQDPLPVQTLIEMTQIDAGSLTQILYKLQAKGLIQTASDSADRRRRTVALTAQGQALKTRAQQVPLKMACQLADLPLSELQTLARLLDQLHAVLSESASETDG